MHKIMIVDDEMIVRHAVQSLILWEEGGFEYGGSAANGQAALELLERTKPDIIITDIKMPDMDGLELIRELAERGFEGEILVLSNYNDFELVREALRCGAHDYMLKLTLKTEQFMKTLGEMAEKLESRRSKNPMAKSQGERGKNSEDQLKEWLEKVAGGDQSKARDESAALEPLERKWMESLAGMRLFSFAFAVQDDGEEGSIQDRNYSDILGKTAEGLFPGNRHMAIIRTHERHYALVAVCPASANLPEPSEIASRMARLARFYYNVVVTVAWGRPLSSPERLSDQLHHNRRALSLGFYSCYREAGIAGEPVENEHHELFRSAESRLRDSLRKTGGSAIELWMEHAIQLVDISAELKIEPRVLKRGITGTIWGVANSAVFKLEGSWDEKPWIEKMETSDSDSALKVLLGDMVHEMNEALEQTARLGGMREEIRHAVSYLEKHYAERVFISDVASQVGLSEPYLCQLFKAETGVSILTMLNDIRMAKARELLASGNYLIKQAAIEVGIPDPFYFNRLFKKKYGVSPKNIKKSI